MMKYIAIVIIGLLFAVNIGAAQNSDKKPQLSEPVETGDNYKVYGSEFPDDAQFFAPGYLVKNSDIFKGQTVVTTGTIKQVCQKKGCFFILPGDFDEMDPGKKEYNLVASSIKIIEADEN